MATKIIRDRKAAVKRAKAKGVDAATARKRNYVRTRSAEMEAKGKKADKKALQKKFQSGQVTRKGFYAKGEGAALRNKAKGKGRGTNTGTNSGSNSGNNTTPPTTRTTPSTTPELPGSGRPYVPKTKPRDMPGGPQGTLWPRKRSGIKGGPASGY